MSKLNKQLFLSLVIVIFISSCGGKSKFEVDVSEIDLTLEINRLDQELLQADLYNLRTLNSKWFKEYDLLYSSFLSQMIQVGYPTDPMITLQLEKYLTDSITRQIADEISTVYDDFSPYSIKLENAFKRYKYYFPDSVVPKIVTFHSNFNAKAFPENHQLGIGLDLFLGKESEITKALSPDDFPGYLKDKMDKQFLVSSVMKHWIYFKFSSPKDFRNNGIYTKKDDFLNTIIHHGKMLYVLDALLPNESIATKLEFTENEMKWCEKGEKFFYQTLIEKKLIYTKNYKNIEIPSFTFYKN